VLKEWFGLIMFERIRLDGGERCIVWEARAKPGGTFSELGTCFRPSSALPSSGAGQGPVAGACEHGKEPSGPIKWGKISDLTEQVLSSQERSCFVECSLSIWPSVAFVMNGFQLNSVGCWKFLLKCRTCALKSGLPIYSKEYIKTVWPG
jgi:hypothetical protein